MERVRYKLQQTALLENAAICLNRRKIKHFVSSFTNNDGRFGMNGYFLFLMNIF